MATSDQPSDTGDATTAAPSSETSTSPQPARAPRELGPEIPPPPGGTGIAPGGPRVFNRPLPPNFVDFDALKVVRRLTQFGYKAYLVGGGVRDFLLGATPKDFDVATDARPREVREVFRNCRLIGRRFRLAHIHFRGGKIIEVSTFRRNPDLELPPEDEDGPEVPEAADAEAGNGDAEGGAGGPGGGGGGGPNGVHARDLLIREDNVFGTEEEDARRRDFTCNALFYDLHRNAILDYVGGVADIERRTIRTIGDPFVRMAEDPVRILRAIRFGARLGLSIEPRTLAAMQRVGPELAKCAAPRLLEELMRILRSANAAGAFALMEQTGALAVTLGEVAAYRERHAVHDEHGKLLAAMDAVQARAGGALHDSVLLATMVWPLVQRAVGGDAGGADGEGAAADGDGASGAPGGGSAAYAAEPWSDPRRQRRDPGSVIADLLRNPSVRLRMPHRLIGRATQLLLAQGKMLAGRRRRFRPEQFARREFFPDALVLLEIRLIAAGESLEPLETWRQLLKNPSDPDAARALDGGMDPFDGGGDSQAVELDGGPRRRRGRRGGRRRRGGRGRHGGSGGGGGGPGPGPGSGSGPATGSGTGGNAGTGSGAAGSGSGTGSDSF